MSSERVNNKLEIDPISFEDEYIYGFKNMGKGIFKIRGVEFPEIVCVINDKRGDKEWLRKMMQRHGLEIDGLSKPQMAYILFRLAGCGVGGEGSDIGFLGLTSIESDFRIYKPELNKLLNDKFIERQEYFLNHPEKDAKIKMYLDIIKEKTGLSALEIFNKNNIPNYYRGSGSPATKVNHSKRSLEQYLFEISLAVSGFSLKEMGIRAKRAYSGIFNSLTNSQRNNSLTDSMVQVIKKIQGWDK